MELLEYLPRFRLPRAKGTSFRPGSARLENNDRKARAQHLACAALLLLLLARHAHMRTQGSSPSYLNKHSCFINPL